MKFASLKSATPDGALVLVARDGRQALPVPHIAASLLDAVQRWESVRPPLEALYSALNAGDAKGSKKHLPLLF